MIDALISDIQNPGRGPADLLSNFRTADFTPSNSPDSFAAYLERISGSVSRQSEYDYGAYRREPAFQTSTQSSSAEAAGESQVSANAAENSARQAAAKASDKASENAVEAADKSGAQKGAQGTGQSGDAEHRVNPNGAEEAAGKSSEDKAAAAQKAAEESEGQAKAGRSKDNSNGDGESQSPEKSQHSKTGQSGDANSAESAALNSDAEIAAGKAQSGQNSEAKREQMNRNERATQTRAAAAEEAELQAGQAAGEQARREQATGELIAKEQEVREQAAQVQSSQQQAAAEQSRRGETEISKELSLQKDGDGKREAATMRELRNRHGEAGRSSDGEGRPKLTVIDRRGASARSGHRGNAGYHGHSGSAGGHGADGKPGFNSLMNGQSGSPGLNGAGLNGSGMNGASSGDSEGLQVMQVHLRGDGAPAGSTAQTAGRSADSGVRGQLLQQLQDHLNNDIVKRSSILIRENGSGEIKLDLKPDTLGQVRIRITMENNHIAGKIFVENSSVKEAFDQNMQQLYRAFKEHGFEDAALNVSVGDQGREQQERGRSHGPQARVASQQIHSLDEQSSTVRENSGELRLVDVMA